MKAEEMFKSLGYEILLNDESLLQYINKTYNVVITFNKLYKYYCAYDAEDCESDVWSFSVKEHKAITKQMIELHWIGED